MRRSRRWALAMKKSVGSHRSVWMGTSKLSLESRLTEVITTDGCIVGGGIAGISIASLLAREGKAVVVLDDGPIGGG